MRLLLRALACLGLALPISALTGAPAPVKKSIACQDKGSYLGNIIDATYSLHICDDSKQTWEYCFTDTHSGTAPATRLTAGGTYDLAGDLAVFTGTLSSDKEKMVEIRFALNYGCPDGRLEFDRLFPAAD